MGTKQRAKRDWRRRLRRTYFSARNATRMIRGGRFTPPYEAEYELAHQEGALRLRHYPQEPPTLPLVCEQPILLVPPLMVTAQVYDISPELSAVAYLRGRGFDVWLVDFGSPERERGGLERTLDDHVLMIARAIDLVRARTGQDVHIAGYSQGGMFVYQAVAYRGSEGVASVVTFGSPVDMQKNIPADVNRGLISNLSHALRVTMRPMDLLGGVPGSLSSLAFKLMSPRKELKYLRMILGNLDDRELLERLEPTRRFLGGEGFVAWPGPAFQTFVDDVIVHNRMMTGGFVIAGRSVTLADITAPVLCFVGERDEFARPRAVRAIDRAAPRAPLFERSADAGHFGLVVGAGALETTWSTVTRWVLWRAGKGPQPAEIVDVRGGGRARQRAARAGGDDLIGEVREAIWDQLGLGLRDVTESARWVRWQVPRLLSLVPVLLRGRVNIGRLLAERAAARPNDTLFLWRGRAYSYAEADARVNKLARALLARGVSPKGHVGILMDNHPDYLTSLLALSRIGAVAVLLNPGVRGPVLEHALAAGKVEQILTSPERAAAAVEAAGADAVARVYLVSAHSEASAALGLESLHERVQADGDDGPPQGVALNPGRAEELAWLMFTSGTTGRPKAAKMTNSRVLGAATLAAVGAGMTARDTVYVSLPLYHATGLVLGATAGFIAGSRVVLAPRFSVSRFWDDVRRHGVTVVLYVGELCRFLINTPEAANEKRHTIRLLVGNGMREDVWREVLRRFGGIRVLEFYAATEGNILLANLTGEKVGSVGRVPFDVLRTELLRYDFERGEVARDDDGNVMLCDDDEPGMLIGQIHPLNPFSRFDGYTDARATGKKIIHNVFTVGDAWFLSGDILRRDADGDFWFVDRVGDTFRWRGENVSTEEVEAVLRAAPGVEQVAVYGIEIAGEEGRAGMAALTLQPGTAALDGAALYEVAESSLAPRARPLFVRVVDALETTVTFKVIKRGLQEQGASLEAAGAGRLFRLDEPARRYAPVESER